MNILITNDDGIFAPGIECLIQWAKKLGQVTVAAPAVEQSAKSHAIEIHRPFRAEQVAHPAGVEAWAVHSTPADCVRFMVLGLGRTYDLVLSGINRGLNVGADTMYSGTLAAVFEAANLGMKAMAVSTEPASFEPAAANLDRVWQFMEENKLFAYGDIYNVNIPLEVKGLRLTSLGGPYFSDRFLPGEDGLYTPDGYSVFTPRENSGFDTDAVLTDQCISVSPLTLDRTDHKALEKLQAAVKTV